MKASIHKTLTANRLGDGLVVFLTATGEWSDRVNLATVAVNGEACSALESSGERAVALRQVVGPYLIDVDVEGADGQVEPVLLRERIRAYGPTVRFLSSG